MELRDRILDAAAKVYSETGFRGATTKRIAERAGVNEITLFRHFGSKTRLLHEAIRCAGTASNLCCLPDRPSDPRAELEAWALATFRELFARRSLIRTALGELEERPEMLPLDRNPSVNAGQQLHGYLERLRADGFIRADIDLMAATMMFMGTLFSDAITRDVIPSMYRVDPERSISHYVDLIARALDLKES